jgi:hypothetical protein
MTKKNKYKSNPNEISLNHLKEILDVLALIESKGKYFKTDSEDNEHISMKQVEDILSNLYESKADWGRTIKTAKAVYNAHSKFSKLQGNKKGSHFNVVKDYILKDDPAYKALFIVGLASLVLDKSLNIDFLNQFFQQETPLSFLMLLRYSIYKKAILSMEYQSDRYSEPSQILQFVPLTINYRDGHWILVCFTLERKLLVQYLIHNIISIKFFKINHLSLPVTYDKPIIFDIKDFYKNSFGLSVLQDREIHTIEIFVPKEFKPKIQKRRREGEWISFKNDYIWKVNTQDLNEVFDYIFRWNGVIKIHAPNFVKKIFQEKLKKFLE